MTYIPMPETRQPFYHVLPDFMQAAKVGVAVPESLSFPDCAAKLIAEAYQKGQPLPLNPSVAYTMLGHRPVDTVTQASLSLSSKESVYIYGNSIALVTGSTKRQATIGDIERALQAIEAFDGLSLVVEDIPSQVVNVPNDIKFLLENQLKLLSMGKNTGAMMYNRRPSTMASALP